jgi:hypothetical protein
MRKYEGFILIENNDTYRLRAGDVICSKNYPFPDDPYIKISKPDDSVFTVEQLRNCHNIKDCFGYARLCPDPPLGWVRLGIDDIIPTDAIWVSQGEEIPEDVEENKFSDNYPGIGRTVRWALDSGYLFHGTDICVRRGNAGVRKPRRLPMNEIFSKPLPLP